MALLSLKGAGISHFRVHSSQYYNASETDEWILPAATRL